VDVSLLEAVVAVIPPRCSVLDIGAGPGQYVRLLRLLGYDAGGLDGSAGIEEMSGGVVRWADLTADCGLFFNSCDWGLFVEVGEHVPPEHEQALIDNVAAIPRTGLLVQWALPGQSGCGHFNCRPADYVREQFEIRGWKEDEDASRIARRFCPPHFMVLRKKQ
jgi:hypothetical protein